MTDKEIIVLYLRDLDDWMLEGMVRSIDTKYGHIGFRGDRNVRDLVKAGILEKRMRGRFAEVRFKRSRITLPPAFAPKQPSTAKLW
jgi:hypothetical protein